MALSSLMSQSRASAGVSQRTGKVFTPLARVSTTPGELAGEGFTKEADDDDDDDAEPMSDPDATAAMLVALPASCRPPPLADKSNHVAPNTAGGCEAFLDRSSDAVGGAATCCPVDGPEFFSFQAEEGRAAVDITTDVAARATMENSRSLVALRNRVALVE